MQEEIMRQIHLHNTEVQRSQTTLTCCNWTIKSIINVAHASRQQHVGVSRQLSNVQRAKQRYSKHSTSLWCLHTSHNI